MNTFCITKRCLGSVISVKQLQAMKVEGWISGVTCEKTWGFFPVYTGKKEGWMTDLYTLTALMCCT